MTEINFPDPSPDIKIYLKIEDKIIRLSDVLQDTATLYSKDFDDVEPGTGAGLVLSIDEKETVQTIILIEGLNKDMDIFHFRKL